MTAQVPFPQISPSNGSAERGAKFGASDATNDFLEITNSTLDAQKYIPAIWAHQQSDNRYALMLIGTTNSSQDNGTIPLMVFRSELRNSLALNAPAGSAFPWGDSGSSVVNRPLFSWQNGSSIEMIMSANGNVSRQLSSSFGGGVANSCLTSNFLTKRNTTGLTCSQVYDNGTNVGIGTTSPANKLTVNGAIQSISNLFISDVTYKKDIHKIKDALNIINNLEGKTYNWKKEEFPDINFEEKLQYGLITQEVEKVMPTIVQTSEDGKKAVNYTAIIPVLIEAIKQQQEQIVALQDQINTDFQKQNSDLINLKNTKIISVSPNPSSDVIVISLNIGETVKDAKIIVYDLNGKIMSSLNVKERNNDITKSLQKDNFGSGIYIVSLVINGKSLDTKKIIFN